MKKSSSQSWVYGAFYTVSAVFTVTAVCYAGYIIGGEKVTVTTNTYPAPNTQNQPTYYANNTAQQTQPATMPNVISSTYANGQNATPVAQTTTTTTVKAQPPVTQTTTTTVAPTKNTTVTTKSSTTKTSSAKTSTPKTSSQASNKNTTTKSVTTSSKTSTPKTTTVVAANTNNNASKGFTDPAPQTTSVSTQQKTKTVTMDAYQNQEGTVDVDEENLPPATQTVNTQPYIPESNMQKEAEYSAKASLPSVDSSQLGWKGPVSLSGLYDNDLGFIADLKYNTGILADAFAGALELQGGERIGRANATVGYAINDRNNVKVSAERLDENMNFDFIDGTQRDWDGQNAIGAAYEYVIPKGKLNAVDVGGYYTHSNSKNLDDAVEVDDLGVPYLAQRRIAGANSANGNVSAVLRLWAMSQLRVGADYDNVNYDTKYIDDSTVNTSGFGGHVSLEQVVTSRVKFNVSAEDRKPFNDFDGELDYLIPSAPNRRIEVGLNSSYTHSKTTPNDYLTNGVTFKMSLGLPTATPNKGDYRDFAAPQISDISTWVNEPAVRMPEVLAIADGSGYNIAPGYAFCPPADQIVWDASSGHYVSKDGQWHDDGTLVDLLKGKPITGMHEALIESSISSPGSPGSLSCIYSIQGGNDNVSTQTANMLNSEYLTGVSPVLGSGNSSWIIGSSINIYICKTGPKTDPNLCPFKTVGAFVPTPEQVGLK